jgi:hypothetical protein
LAASLVDQFLSTTRAPCLSVAANVARTTLAGRAQRPGGAKAGTATTYDDDVEWPHAELPLLAGFYDTALGLGDSQRRPSVSFAPDKMAAEPRGFGNEVALFIETDEGRHLPSVELVAIGARCVKTEDMKIKSALTQIKSALALRAPSLGRVLIKLRLATAWLAAISAIPDNTSQDRSNGSWHLVSAHVGGAFGEVR